MEDFIKALIVFDDEMISSIRNKFDNNLPLDETDLIYLNYCKDIKERFRKIKGRYKYGSNK